MESHAFNIAEKNKHNKEVILCKTPGLPFVIRKKKKSGKKVKKKVSVIVRNRKVSSIFEAAVKSNANANILF